MKKSKRSLAVKKFMASLTPEQRREKFTPMKNRLTASDIRKAANELKKVSIPVDAEGNISIPIHPNSPFNPVSYKFSMSAVTPSNALGKTSSAPERLDTVLGDKPYQSFEDAPSKPSSHLPSTPGLNKATYNCDDKRRVDVVPAPPTDHYKRYVDDSQVPPVFQEKIDSLQAKVDAWRKDAVVWATKTFKLEDEITRLNKIIDALLEQK